MCTLYVNDSSPESVESGLAPRTTGAPPANLSVSGASIESEPVSSDVDTHLSLFAEAVGGEAIYTGADKAN